MNKESELKYRKMLGDYCESRGGCNLCEFDSDKPQWCDAGNEYSVPTEQLEVLIMRINPDAIEKTEEPEPPKEPEYDVVNRPEHYCHGGMETIDEMELVFGTQAVINFCILNAWKYRARAMYKNGEEDMKKSSWYIKKADELKAKRVVGGEQLGAIR